MNSRPFCERILIIDDDETVRGYLQTLFLSKGYIIETAGRVEEALQRLSETWYPVVITDLRLPGRSGFEVLNYIHEQRLRSAVLVVTAYGTMESVIEALRHGAYDYIPKPFASSILLHRVGRAMEMIRMEEEKKLQDQEVAYLHQMTRDLSSRLVYATEEERRRISRDIHDGIGQSLLIMKLTLKAMGKRIAFQQVDGIREEIDGLAAHLHQTLDEVTRILKDLNPSYVTEVGFLQTLRLYLETFSKKTGIDVTSSLPENFIFSNSQQEIHFYRIAQEALTNIAKHSGATHAEIRLEPKEDSLLLSIVDNGQGFEESEDNRKVGLGLIGMRERATLLGGTICIESVPNQGTRVLAEIPYESPLTRSRP
jgi:signal transduction histidine kinase